MNNKTAVILTIFTMTFGLCACSDAAVPEETAPAATVTAATQGFIVYDPNAPEETEEYVPRERSIPEDDEFDHFTFDDDGTCILPGTRIRFTLPSSYEVIDEAASHYQDAVGEDGDRRILFEAEDDDVGLLYVMYMGPYNFMNSSFQSSASDVIDRMNDLHLEDGGYTNTYTISYEMDGRECEAYAVLALYSNYPDFTQVAFLVGDHDSAYYVFCQNGTREGAESIISLFEELE